MSRRQAPGERSAVRKAVIAAALPLALLAAVIGQLTVVNRLPLPGGDGPDLVLLLVTAVAVRATPLIAAFTGFAGGLALDVAPPQAHYAGEYALVFCLAGYGAARVGAVARDGSGDRSAATSLTILAAAAAAGEAGKAALGLLLADPDVTGPAIGQVLPGSVLGDLLLSPVALWLVSIVAGRPSATYVPRPEFAAAGRLAAVFRLASAGAAPGLRLAGSGPVHQGPSWARRPPKLRLSGARSQSFGRTSGAGSPTAQPLLAGGRATTLHLSSHRRSGSFGRTSGAGSPTVQPLLAGGRATTLHLSSHGGAARYAPARRPARAPSRGWLRRDRAASPASVRHRTPGKGWLRTARPSRSARRVRSSPSKGWLRSPRRSPARLSWPASASSRTWLRRGRRSRGSRGSRGHLPGGAAAYVSRPYPARRRSYSRRLLAIVGVRR